MGYLYIGLTIALSAYGQLVLKWRLNTLGPLPAPTVEKGVFLLRALLDPFVLSSFGAAFLASLTWMAALTKFDLTYAYPFMSFTFLVVALVGYWWLQEPMNPTKVIGLLLVVLGIIVASR